MMLRKFFGKLLMLIDATANDDEIEVFGGFLEALRAFALIMIKIKWY